MATEPFTTSTTWFGPTAAWVSGGILIVLKSAI